MTCDACLNAASFECCCSRCQRDPVPEARYHSCVHCKDEVASRHLASRGQVMWLHRIAAPAPPKASASRSVALEVLLRCRAELEAQRAALAVAMERLDEAIAAVNALPAGPSNKA